jgi:hypothetical protein
LSAIEIDYKRVVPFKAARLAPLPGTRVGGFVLTREKAAGKWGEPT